MPGPVAGDQILDVRFMPIDTVLAMPDEKLVSPALFRDRNFSLANLAITTVGFGVTAQAFPITLYAQGVRGLSPTGAAPYRFGYTGSSPDYDIRPSPFYCCRMTSGSPPVAAKTGTGWMLSVGVTF